MDYLAILIMILVFGLGVAIAGRKHYSAIEQSQKLELTNGDRDTDILSDANLDDVVPNGFSMGCTVKVTDPANVPVEISEPVIEVFDKIFELQELDAWKNRESYVTVTSAEMQGLLRQFRQLVNEILEMGEFADLLKQRDELEKEIDVQYDKMDKISYVQTLVEEEEEIRGFLYHQYKLVFDVDTGEVTSPENVQDDPSFFTNAQDKNEFEQKMWRLDSIRAILLHYDILSAEAESDEVAEDGEEARYQFEQLSKDWEVLTEQIKTRIPTSFDQTVNQVVAYVDSVKESEQEWLENDKKAAEQFEKELALEAQREKEIEEQLKIENRKNFQYTDMSKDLQILSNETKLARFHAGYFKE